MAGLLIGLIALSTVSCTLPQVSAEDRLFLPLSVERAMRPISSPAIALTLQAGRHQRRQLSP
ncbi:MAG: hypothetical protein AAFO87_09930 [Cyanobacteria bacterium J06607_6]